MLSVKSLVRIAKKICLSFKYSPERNGCRIIVDDRKWISFYVVKENEDAFKVYEFIKFADLEKIALSQISRASLEESIYYILFLQYLLPNYDNKAIYDYYKGNKDYLVKYIHSMKNHTAPLLLKNITIMGEKYLYQHKYLYNKVYDFNRKQFAVYMMKNLKMPLLGFQSIWGDVGFEENDDSGVKQFKYHNWNILLEDNTKDRKDVEKLLDTVQRFCRKLKNDLCYGKVEVVSTLKGKALAQYYEQNDSVRIKAKTNLNKQFIQNFLHELGHRYFLKIATSDFKSKVVKKYNDMISNRQYADLKSGDNVVLKSGTSFEVKQIQRDGGVDVFITDMPKKRGRKKYNIGQRIIFFPIQIEFIDLINGNKVKPNKYVFPSAYARQNVEQFFSECFAHWLTGDLNKDLNQFMQEIFR